MLPLHFPNSIQSHRHDRNIQVLREQPNATPKFHHSASLGFVHFALWENEHAIAAIDAFTGIAKALAKSRKLGQGKDVEQRRNQPVAQLIRPSSSKKPIRRWSPHLLQGFSAHRRSQPMSVVARQGRKNQPNIRTARNMVRHYNHRPAQPVQIVPTNNFRMPQNLRSRPNQSVVHGKPQPPHRRSQGPSWISIFSASSRRRPQQPFHVANSFRFREGRLAQFHLITLFQGTHQFYTIQRTQVQLVPDRPRSTPTP